MARRYPERRFGKRGRPVADRLAERARVTESGCIEYTGNITNNGYGYISIAGKNQYTHRAAWVAEHGDIPDGLFVRHKCDNPPCMNLDHLELGTHSDNMLDMWGRGRATMPTGENHYRATLTDEQVAEIRERWPNDIGVQQKHLAEEYGVSRPLISLICSGKTRVVPTYPPKPPC